MNTDRKSKTETPRMGKTTTPDLDALTKEVIGACFEVSNKLGVGFLEKVYERALVIELGLRGIAARQQVPVPVSYKGQSAGEYFADILVEESVLIELKCAKEFSREHVAQCLNYLKATGFELCLLINFGKTRVECQRIVNQVQ